jgi:hypothetical protein
MLSASIIVVFVVVWLIYFTIIYFTPHDLQQYVTPAMVVPLIFMNAVFFFLMIISFIFHEPRLSAAAQRC